MNKKVCILQKYIQQYRTSFYVGLRKALSEEGVELILIGGQGSSSERARKDGAQIPWAITSRDLYLFGEKLIIQPCLRRALSADLVIIEQANKLLLNCLLQFLCPFSRFKLAFWGHGFCHQQQTSSLSNRFKSCITKHVDWWFAYTSLVADHVAAQGFPRERITVVQNAIDTSSLKQMALQVSAEEIISVRKRYNLTEGKTGVFCSSMYREKQLPFLIECAERLHEKEPEFSMVFIGSGTDEHLVQEAALKHAWVHNFGPQFGMEKVKFILAADFMLSPGLVGLNILDSFALERPLVTTDYPLHSPEISYLENGVNGAITPFLLEPYTAAIAALMQEPRRLQELKRGCIESGKRYTIETMVDNFTEGIRQCLRKGNAEPQTV